MSLLGTAVWTLGLLCTLSSALQEGTKPVRNVAIIGAGVAGSSAAYHLRKYALQDGAAVNITIFEKTDHIGGRTLTIDPFGNANNRVELGASIFIRLNHILYNATQVFGLSTGARLSDDEGLMAIWDGDKIVVQIDQSLPYWRIILQILWKYGIQGPRKTQQLMKETIGKFLNLYEAPYFPFKSLTQRTYELDLLDATSVPGAQFLAKHGVSELYAHDVIQASTRVNYASNLPHIHGLETMVSMAPEGAMAVIGGNWQIFDNMVMSSRAALAFNTSITTIELQSVKNSHSGKSKYTLKTKSTAASADEEETHPVTFDDVVVATPWQYSKIATAEGVLSELIDEIPYIELHVTIFASPFAFSPTFFNLAEGAKVPTIVLTTLGSDETEESGVQGAGKAGFYSISTLRRVFNPKTKKVEYLYKIFSPEKLTSEFLSDLFGTPIPKDIIGSVETKNPAESHAVEPISWYYPHVFHSYPKAFPRVTFQDPILGPGLYYTSGMESFISTMETNALMGMNVARLIVDDILGVSRGDAVVPPNGRPQGNGSEDEL